MTEYVCVQIKEWKNEDMNLDVFFFLYICMCLCVCECVWVCVCVCVCFPPCLHGAMFWQSQSDEQVFPPPLLSLSHSAMTHFIPCNYVWGKKKKIKQTLILFSCVKLSKKKNWLPNTDVTRFNLGHPRSTRRPRLCEAFELNACVETNLFLHIVHEQVR